MKTYLCVVACLLVALGADVLGGKLEDAARAGNEAFKKKDYKAALEKYRLAETEQPQSAGVNYNLGGTYYHEEKYEEAAQEYNEALQAADPQLDAQTHYNLGNTYYRMGDYPKAISEYESALKANPDDMDAKFNLELARKMLKENTQAQQQNNQQNQQQKDQQQNQQQKQQQNQEQQTKEQEEGQNQDKNNKQQGQRSEQDRQGQKMSKEDAERILNALRDDERDIQRKVRKGKAEGDYVGKDW